jgi:hypothetical protein
MMQLKGEHAKRHPIALLTRSRQRQHHDFTAIFSLSAAEKFGPSFETVRFAIALVPKLLQAFLGTKLLQCVSVADETKPAVTLIAAVRRQSGPPSGCLRRSFLHLFHGLLENARRRSH